MYIHVLCTRGNGDKEAPSLSDSRITNDNMAALRGKRFLDDPSQGNYYTVKNRSLRVPHKGNNIVPGDWVTVSDGKLGLSSQKVKIKTYSISITPSGVWADIETQQFVEPTTDA